MRLAPLTLAALLALPAAAAPVPKAVKKKADHFPLRVGDRWVLECSQGSGSTEEVISVTDHADGSRTATVEETFGRTTRQTVYRVTAGRVLKRDPDRPDHDGDEYMRTELTTGDTWAAGNEVYRVGEAEEVTVPAGKFTAFRVTRSVSGTDVCTMWYAPEVGWVKSEFGGDAKTVWSLKSYSRGDARGR